MDRRVRHVVLTAIAVGLIAGASAAWAAPYVILPSGQKQVGSGVTVEDDGTILLETKDGVLTCPKGTRVFVDKPADYDRAVQMLQRRQYDTAAELLETIVKKYRFLGWDRKATALLARCYMGKRDYEKSVAAYESVFKADPTSIDSEDNRQRYLEALLGSKSYDKLRPKLDETIAKGPRADEAVAQMMRGNISLDEGNLDAALSDFMRTAELFTEATDVLPEAILKTAECLAKLGHTALSLEFYNRVIKEFPDSPQAAEAKQKKP